MKQRISPSMIIATVALFFSLGGASLAASHYLVTNVHQIKPSVRRELRGARGPAGPQGASGAQGAAGAQGPAGFALSAVAPRPVKDATTVPAGGSATVIAECTGGSIGTIAAAGGFQAEPGLQVTSSYLASSSSWAVTASNPTSSGLTLTAQAVCQ